MANRFDRTAKAARVYLHLSNDKVADNEHDRSLDVNQAGTIHCAKARRYTPFFTLAPFGSE